MMEARLNRLRTSGYSARINRASPALRLTLLNDGVASLLHPSVYYAYFSIFYIIGYARDGRCWVYIQGLALSPIATQPLR